MGLYGSATSERESTGCCEQKPGGTKGLQMVYMGLTFVNI
jgi:hypothetical protein